MVQVHVRVDEQRTPQFGRLAQLAGVTPPVAVEQTREADVSSKMSKAKVDESRLTPRRRGKSKTTLNNEDAASSKSIMNLSQI
jgi:hypothetical protein